MPVTYRSRGGSSERLVQKFLDWSRTLMQLSALATLLLIGYVIYGFMFGGVGQWAALDAATRTRIASNIQGALFYLNLAVGLLLLTSCILYYDEEGFGYALVAGALFLYFGVPFLFSQLSPTLLTDWGRENNVAALAVYDEFLKLGLALAVPGAILTVRDLILRIADGVRRKREEFSAMQYGGSVQEETPPSAPLIGLFAKCWQMSFCRDAIRKNCPIFHARTRCWRERVGCMCEEKVIRHAMDAILHRDLSGATAAPDSGEKSVEASGLIQMDAVPAEPQAAEDQPEAAAEKTAQVPARPRPARPISPRDVKIPHNPHLSPAVKRERCRNCVIYNEHQRLKYQFFAPLVVLAVPALAYWKIDVLSGTLNQLLATADRIMQNLSLQQNPTQSGLISSLTTTNVVAQYFIIGCLIVIVTTMALRFLEYCIFEIKI